MATIYHKNLKSMRIKNHAFVEAADVFVFLSNKLLELAIRESLSQFENQIMPRVYISSTTRSTMYQKFHFVSRNWCMEN